MQADSWQKDADLTPVGLRKASRPFAGLSATQSINRRLAAAEYKSSGPLRHDCDTIFMPLNTHQHQEVGGLTSKVKS